MKFIMFLVLTVFAIACNQTPVINPTFEEIAVGKLAPEFSLMGSDGKTYNLKDYRGKVVVLEWTNFDCPFVKKHYDAKKMNMQNLQKKYTEQDVVWFSIISSAAGKQGHLTVDEAKAAKEKLGSNSTAILLDTKSEVGRLYGAKTTPHMYILDKEGNVFYRGAIDSIASTEVDDIEKAQNYVSEALDAVIFNQKILINPTTAYGCSVKY